MEETYNYINDLLLKRWESTYKSVSLTLQDAILYSLKAGGKRYRPLLAYAVWKYFNPSGDVDDILPFLSAIESIHTYSLIHDDLPSIDNDTLRRGKPTNHVVYGEAVAILAGDALLTVAFNEMSLLNFPSDRVLQAIRYLSDSAGILGMVAGQVLDIENDGSDRVTEEYLRKVNIYKTGALIKASLVVPAILSAKDIKDLETVGDKLGLAFQLMDDYLSLSKTTLELGKTAGIDEKKQIKTFVSIYGKTKVLELSKQLVFEAKNIINDKFKADGLLLKLADMVTSRVN